MKLWSEPNSSQLLKPPFFQIIQKKKKNTESFLNSISRYASFVCLPSGEAFLLFFFCFSILSESMWFWIVWLCFRLSFFGICSGSSWFHSEIIMLKGFSVFLGRFLFIWFYFVFSGCNRNGTSNVVCRNRDGAVLQPVSVDKLKPWILRDWKC